MDGPHLRQRPASNISLHSTYRAHGRPINYSSYRQTPNRRPLRSVNENVALLRGTGPLESMLKTTTETGDIGIFSIKPRSSHSISSTAMCLSPSGSRPLHGDPRRSPRSCARDYDDDYFYRDHERLRSNRDTTSEILSLYGSECQQTMPTSVSPSLDDGMRSYSMTTTSSRHGAPFHRFPGSLQSPTGGHFVQRPRSPFPYPTRLKRPGVRPASPALGENGDVDYSRMVELERYSQRTIHGSYKATYTHGHRRPPPLSLRADANRSTASLPSRTSPSPYFFGPPNFRVQTPTTPWTSRHFDRHQSASVDQSTRSASLTSIVEMYSGPASHSNSSRPLHSTSSFYYDYTEEFENQPPLDVEQEVPLCPIPQRAGSIRRPMVLRDDSPIGLEPAENGSNAAKAGPSKGEIQVPRDDNDSNHGEPRDENEPPPCHIAGKLDQSQPAENTEPGDPPQGMPTASPGKTKRDRPVSAIVKRASLRASSHGPLEEPEDAVLRELSPNRRTWRMSGAATNTSHEGKHLGSPRESRPSLAKLRCSLDPALSDFASILSSFDRVGKTPSPTREVEASPASQEHDNVGPVNDDDDEDDGDADAQQRPDRRLSLPILPDVAGEKRAYRKGHRRNFAALRISTTAIAPECVEVFRGPNKPLPILSPEPISPIRQLRVKQSIPYLMKALPPLPREARSPLSQTAAVTDDVSRACGDVLQTLQEIIDEETRLLDPETKPPPSPIKQPRASQPSPPKFKIRARTSLSAAGDGSSEGPITDEGENTLSAHVPRTSPATKPRLKLKISRSQLGGQSRVSYNVPGLANNRLKQCNSLAEVAAYPRNDLEAEGSRIACSPAARWPVSEQTSPPDVRGASRIEEEKDVEEEKSSARSVPLSEPSDQFNISYPPLPVKVDVSPALDERERLSRGTASFMSSPNRQRGLQSKLSYLRLRFVRAQSSTSSMTYGASPSPRRQEAAPVPPLPPLPSTMELDDSDDSGTEKDRRSRLRPGQNGWRLKRWAHDAKRAVRSYVKRNLDR